MSTGFWQVEFFQDSRSQFPVQKWLRSMTKKERAHIIRKIEMLETRGTSLGFPHVKQVDGKLWELRTRLNRRAFRIFYVIMSGNRIVLLHGFVKSTDKTPPNEIEVAKGRMRSLLN